MGDICLSQLRLISSFATSGWAGFQILALLHKSAGNSIERTREQHAHSFLISVLSNFLNAVGWSIMQTSRLKNHSQSAKANNKNRVSSHDSPLQLHNVPNPLPNIYLHYLMWSQKKWMSEPTSDLCHILITISPRHTMAQEWRNGIGKEGRERLIGCDSTSSSWDSCQFSSRKSRFSPSSKTSPIYSYYCIFRIFFFVLFFAFSHFWSVRIHENEQRE